MGGSSLPCRCVAAWPKQVMANESVQAYLATVPVGCFSRTADATGGAATKGAATVEVSGALQSG